MLIVTLLVGESVDSCKAVEGDETGGVCKRGRRWRSDEGAVKSASEASAMVARGSLIVSKSLSCELSSLGRLRSCSASSESPAEVLRSLAEFSNGKGAILIAIIVQASHGDTDIFWQTDAVADRNLDDELSEVDKRLI